MSLSGSEQAERPISGGSSAPPDALPNALDTRSESDEFAPPGRSELVRLLLIFVPLVVYKIVFASHTWNTSIDGGYYSDIARHVRDGLGLTTHVSLYHHAYPNFPHPSPVYPLWPLLYGLVGRYFDLLRVGIWLPTCLYFAGLSFAYLWARRLVSNAKWLGFDLGHAFVLLLATTRDFYVFTSRPYTEGLAFTLIFIGIWRAQKGWANPSWRYGAELGLWLGLGFLARSQMIIFMLAALCVLGAAAVVSRQRRGYAQMGLAALTAMIVILAPHYIRVQEMVEIGGFGPVFAFDRARASWILSDYPVMVETSGLWDFIKDRASGIPVAFDISGQYSYTRQFYLIQYALPIALILLATSAIKLRRVHFDRAWDWLRSPSAPAPVFFVVFALGGLVSLHLIHKVYFIEWNFARRQSIICLFAFFAAWTYLVRHRYLAIRVLAIALLVASTAQGLALVHNRSLASLSNEGPNPKLQQLTRWLNERAEARDGITVAINRQMAQRAAPYTTEVGYHWIHVKTTVDDLQTLINEFGVQYVILLPDSASSTIDRNARSAWLRKNMKSMFNLGNYRIFEPRRDP